jgi:hypothetical protein
MVDIVAGIVMPTAAASDPIWPAVQRGESTPATQ